MAPWSGRVASEASAGPIDQVGIPWAPSLCSLCLLPEDEQREKSVSHQTVQQLVLEKEQALADLNSVEKSLADLFRRYEKMKEVLEGFRKVCWCSGPEQEGCAWGRAGGGSGSAEMWGVLDGRLCPPAGATPNPWGLGLSRPRLHLHLRVRGVPSAPWHFFCGLDPWPLSCQNEEVLKKCAQEYLSRVKKEEQRYQALKVHAEEKLDRYCHAGSAPKGCLAAPALAWAGWMSPSAFCNRSKSACTLHARFDKSGMCVIISRVPAQSTSVSQGWPFPWLLCSGPCFRQLEPEAWFALPSWEEEGGRHLQAEGDHF